MIELKGASKCVRVFFSMEKILLKLATKFSLTENFFATNSEVSLPRGKQERLRRCHIYIRVFILLQNLRRGLSDDSPTLHTACLQHWFGSWLWTKFLNTTASIIRKPGFNGCWWFSDDLSTPINLLSLWQQWNQHWSMIIYATSQAYNVL